MVELGTRLTFEPGDRLSIMVVVGERFFLEVHGVPDAMWSLSQRPAVSNSR